MTPADDMSLRADPALVEAWLRARSLSRDYPPPVPNHGGWRVETGQMDEVRRYVFAAPAQAVSDLARTILKPRIFLKLCGSQAQMKSLLPSGWALQPTISMMTCDAPTTRAPALPAGYTLEISTADAKTGVRILASDGTSAASGYAVESTSVFIYDRIVVEPERRRRGLGKALMSGLVSARRSLAATQVLVATAEGKALYATLGWKVHTPYTTASIPKLEPG